MVQCHKYKQLYIIVFVENGYMQTDNRLIQKETIYYCIKGFRLNDENYNVVKEAVDFSNMVGFLTGYYDDRLTIASVSAYFLESLGYEYDEFMQMSYGSLKNLFFGENQSFLEIERFKKIHGSGEGQMIDKADAPVYVRMYKADTVDENGNKMWVLSVKTDWVQQNLKLINNVLKSGMWYFDFDMNGDIAGVFWSHEFRRMLGYHDILDFPNRFEMWEESIHPDDRQKVLSLLKEVLDDTYDEKKYHIEYRVRRINGQYQWFRTNAEVIRSRDGLPIRMVGTFVNIEEQREQELFIKKSDAFHRAYTKSNICEYYVNLKDNTFDSLKVEDSLFGIFEKSTTWDELIHEYLDKFVCEEDKSAVALIYNRAYILEKFNDGSRELSIECRIKINGEERLVRNVVMPGEEEGVSRYAMILVRDITEARKQADEIREMTRKNVIMDKLIQGTIKLVDRFAMCNIKEDTYKVYSILPGENVHGYVGNYRDYVEDISSTYKVVSEKQSMKSILSEENLNEIFQNVGSNYIYKFEYCTLDEKIFKNMAVIPISKTESGKIESIMLIVQDITQEKQMEIASRKALKDAYDAANLANHSKTEFLSNMSHDIRTPMNAIVGMTAIAGANIDNKERVIDCLGKITKSSRHLLGLINEVLDMSRIESGRFTLSEEDFNLAELVDNLVTMTKNDIEAHSHNFEVRVGKINHENVFGDSLRLQQVITNVMSNAIKYTPDGGNIIFSIEEKHDKSKNIGCYEFSVEDNGIGMTKEFQEVIFEPFARADNKRTTKIQGTGLGMTIVRNIVNMMNGNIKIESEPGKGSKFIITVFLKLQDEERERIEELIDLPVLVVDDDEICCENAINILDDIGINGEWTTSGSKAVEMTRKRHELDEDYFAVIVDLRMPEMNGIETARQIRKIVGKDITIIVLTAYDYSLVEDEAREAGVDAFITKPLFRSRLVTMLRNIIKGKPGRSATKYLSGISKSDYSGQRILLVEDNELNREIAKEIIEMTGAIVDTAENGKEAVEKVMDTPDDYYRLVFMDIQMPVMNGYEAAAAIRGLDDKKKASIPIVAMTANAFAEDIMLAKNAGMNEHMAKPLDINKLNETLRKWL